MVAFLRIASTDTNNKSMSLPFMFRAGGLACGITSRVTTTYLFTKSTPTFLRAHHSTGPAWTNVCWIIESNNSFEPDIVSKIISELARHNNSFSKEKQ